MNRYILLLTGALLALPADARGEEIAQQPPAGFSFHETLFGPSWYDAETASWETATWDASWEAEALSPDELFPPRVRETYVPPLEQLEEAGAVIGNVFIRVGEIFDPEDPRENHRLFRLANRLKIRTRQLVIDRQLLFAPGDPLSVSRIQESERLLRSLPFLYNAEIRPIAWRGNRVDLEVHTRDVWTLKVGVGVSREGGESSTRFEIQDSNFLGTGRDLTFRYSEDVDRTSSLLRYRDNSLFGTRGRLELVYGDNSDGDVHKVRLERPFFSVETRWAAGLEIRTDDRVESLYSLGRITDQYRRERTYLHLEGGRSKGLQGDRAHRWLAGFTFQRDVFSPANGPIRLHTPLEDRTLSYPWVGFESVGNHYREVEDLDLIGRTEDLELGPRYFGRLGWSSRLFGGGEEAAVFQLGASLTTVPKERHLLILSSHASGRWDGEAENLHVGGEARYYWRNLGRHMLYVGLHLDAVERRDPESQLLLGGDSGLRGYPLRYQDGDRRALLTVEQRFYSDWQLFRLAYLGAAVFMDVGSAWFSGDDRAAEQGLLTNVGLGLRLSPSRSAFGSMVHLDVAFPLDGDPSIQKVQWLVSTRETF